MTTSPSSPPPEGKYVICLSSQRLYYMGSFGLGTRDLATDALFTTDPAAAYWEESAEDAASELGKLQARGYEAVVVYIPDGSPRALNVGQPVRSD